MLGSIKRGTREWDRIVAEAARTVPPREHGGNCDIKNLSRGSRVPGQLCVCCYSFAFYYYYYHHHYYSDNSNSRSIHPILRNACVTASMFFSLLCRCLT